MSVLETSPAAVVSPRSDYTSGKKFVDMPLSPEVIAGLEAMGYADATPIQAAGIAPALAGKDLILRAKTGTGKTAAFGIPVIEGILAGERKTRALILAPTRELALQISQELAGIARFKDLTIAAIYGGVSFGPQQDALRGGAEIVVGTPGRLLDHIKRGNLILSEISHAVLDEADEMLSMGFLEDVRKILDRTPTTRQTLLCSATLDESMKRLIGGYLREPQEILLSADGDNVETVAHILYETSPDYHKARALLDLLEQERPTAAIIFCNTREDVSTVYTYLDRQGLGVEMLTGELPQARREKVMARIKAGAVQFLVSTDVAARGIDISDLSHVINYALPDDAAVYLHRIGRTGRIGKTGTALSLVGGADFSSRLSLERLHKIRFEVRELPAQEDVRRLRAERIAKILKDASGNSAFESYLDTARALKDLPDADVLIATALRAFFQLDRSRKQALLDEANEVAEAPQERAREDRPREDRPREDRSRDDRGRERRPREDRRPRDERPRDERPREDRPREDRPREKQESPAVAEAAPEGADDEHGAETDVTEEVAGSEGFKRRRRRKRRSTPSSES